MVSKLLAQLARILQPSAKPPSVYRQLHPSRNLVNSIASPEKGSQVRTNEDS